MASDYHALRKLNELVKDIHIAMLTSIRGDGMPHSRPMATQAAESDGELWFFTGRSTQKFSEIEANPNVNLSYADAEHNRYVSVSGEAELVDNRAKAKELWNPLFKAWFPKGLEDPELILLKVTVEHVEYWDAPSSTMVQLAGFVKAAVTGRRGDGGNHGEFDLTGQSK